MDYLPEAEGKGQNAPRRWWWFSLRVLSDSCDATDGGLPDSHAPGVSLGKIRSLLNILPHAPRAHPTPHYPVRDTGNLIRLPYLETKEEGRLWGFLIRMVVFTRDKNPLDSVSAKGPCVRGAPGVWESFMNIFSLLSSSL